MRSRVMKILRYSAHVSSRSAGVEIFLMIDCCVFACPSVEGVGAYQQDIGLHIRDGLLGRLSDVLASDRARLRPY